MSEMKTEDIIESLRVCAGFDACEKCIFANEDARCSRSLMEEAADWLEQLNTFDKTQSARLLCKINALETENELLRGTLKSFGHSEEMHEMKIDVKQLLKIASAVPIAEYNGRKLYAGTWHHFKGKDYFVCGIATHTETGETLVLYKDSFADPKQYARPLAMFLSEVDREKYPDAPQKYRFERRNDT